MEKNKGGVILISPSSTNFTAVFLSSLFKGMELRFYSLKIRKMEKNTEKTTLLCPFRIYFTVDFSFLSKGMETSIDWLLH